MKRNLITWIMSITAVIFLVADPVASYCALKENGATAGDYEIITPRTKPQPRINGPLVYGCRPGHPFLYRIPCQGERPIRFTVKGLPKELILDPVTGIISGITPAKGEYQLVIQAVNAKGKNKRNFKIVADDQLALTPPMGWNHWYAHYDRITDKMMREAADVMIKSGMADVGYQYVNIDDCWMNAPKNNDPKRVGPLRDEQGNIVPNKHFPDMKGLTGYIHNKGLKTGIYTSPGKDKSLEAFQKPYRQMGTILKSLNRDIVFNLCQYGMGDVWKWGGEVGDQCWRTSGDLGFELDQIFNVALKNSEHRQYSKTDF